MSVSTQFVGVAQTEAPQQAVWMSDREMEMLCQHLDISFSYYGREAISLTQTHREVLRSLSTKLTTITKGLESVDEIFFVPISFPQPACNQANETTHESEDLDPELVNYSSLIPQ